MAILVTGARGFIGRHVALQLSRAGTSVLGLGHGAWTESAYSPWGVTEWFNGEVSHANLDSVAMRHGIPDAVIHLAGGSSVGPSFAVPAEDFRRSVLAAGELAEWLRLRAPATPVLMASSAAVYGASHLGSISEAAPCSPFSPYGFHKRMAELVLESYARNFGLKVAVVRLFSVYGPELRKQLLWDACSRLKKEAENTLLLGGTGGELRDWLHVEDAARLISRAVEFASTDCFIVNGGTGVATSVREIAEEVCLAWGGNARPAFSGQSRSGDPVSLVASPNLMNQIGITPTRSWQAGIAEFVSWFRLQEGGGA